jgi:hypothetical protein
MAARPDRQRAGEPRDARQPAGLGRWGSLRGGAGVAIVVGSAAAGAAITIATRTQPGEVLGGCIVAGTVAAALAVRPRAGRLIFPVPALSYLFAALVAGMVNNRSSSTTELVLGATQWIADGFFLMALATVLAIVLTTARWSLRRHGGRGPAAPDRRPRADTSSRRPPAGRNEPGRDEPRPPRGYPAPPPRPPHGEWPQGPPGPDRRGGPYPEQRPGPRNAPYPGQSPGPGYGLYPQQAPGRRGPASL